MRFLLAVILALVACRPASSPRHPSLAKGIAALERITAETLDHDFGHPDFEEAARHFEAVPASSPDHATAVELLERIRAGRERYEARVAEARRAAAEQEAERLREEAQRVERTVELAQEERAAFELREADAKVAAEREEAERQARLARAREEGDRLVEARERRAAERAEVAERERAREAALAERAARCEAARRDCREKCAWVTDAFGKTGGLGSPVSMRCLERCPKCTPLSSGQ